MTYFLQPSPTSWYSIQLWIYQWINPLMKLELLWFNNLSKAHQLATKPSTTNWNYNNCDVIGVIGMLWSHYNLMWPLLYIRSIFVSILLLLHLYFTNHQVYSIVHSFLFVVITLQFLAKQMVTQPRTIFYSLFCSRSGHMTKYWSTECYQSDVSHF
jgi:hypothetical protein